MGVADPIFEPQACNFEKLCIFCRSSNDINTFFLYSYWFPTLKNGFLKVFRPYIEVSLSSPYSLQMQILTFMRDKFLKKLEVCLIHQSLPKIPFSLKVGLMSSVSDRDLFKKFFRWSNFAQKKYTSVSRAILIQFPKMNVSTLTILWYKTEVPWED